MTDPAPSIDWRTLCELASKENNPQKLLHLIQQINRALEGCRPGGTSPVPRMTT